MRTAATAFPYLGETLDGPCLMQIYRLRFFLESYRLPRGPCELFVDVFLSSPCEPAALLAITQSNTLSNVDVKDNFNDEGVVISLNGTRIELQGFQEGIPISLAKFLLVIFQPRSPVRACLTLT